MEQKKLDKILKSHGEWLSGKGGQRANLIGADLEGADLIGAELKGAILSGANLAGANLAGANLIGADLRRADLKGANLRGADLRSADLEGAELKDCKLPDISIVPEKGSFIGWKKVLTEKRGEPATAELLILENSLRMNPLGSRKCRAEKVKVLSLQTLKGERIKKAESIYHARNKNCPFYYKEGEIITADKYDPDTREKCSHGIHFFITKKEAEEF